jgi:RimJ/RimL family protein N-acetyltransferase
VSTLRIATARLDLVAATLEHVEAEIDSPGRLPELFAAEVPPSWPPGEYDQDALAFFREKLQEGGEKAVGWYGWYAVRRATDDAPAALVGAGGFLGPPSDGAVELGYSVAPEHRGRGYATELARALVRRALGTAGVSKVVAHTTRANPGSITVLERCGFRAVAEDPGTGRVRFEKTGLGIHLRLATLADRPALEELIPVSARALSRGFYTEAQTEAAIRYVFGPDTRLIADGTYFLVDEGGTVAGCGGWSRRQTLYGGDQMKAAEDPLLDPRVDAARIRAFFVHPAFARRGVGTAILDACLDAARAAGFRRVELASTLPGVPFYRALGFSERESLGVPMPDGQALPIIRMEREL